MLLHWKAPFSLFLFLILAVSGGAQEPPEIDVVDVRFNRIANNWTAAVIRIRADGNPSPDAFDDDFLDDVRLTFHTCYEVDRGADGDSFSFYNSEVRMLSLDKSRTYQIAFFLPGVIRDRDDLDVDPFAWLIRMEAAGVEIPLADDQFGGEIKSKAAYDSFLSKANSEGPQNDGILLPVYLAPFFVVNESRLNLADIPAFYRFESRN